jgi:hypothetical protein
MRNIISADELGVDHRFDRLHSLRAFFFSGWRGGFSFFVLALTTHCTSADAQVLNAVFPQTGTGAGGVPADNSRAVAAADYVALGIQAGSFDLFPTLTESAGYDSDVHLLGVGSSPVIDSSGQVVARSDWTRNSLEAELSVDDRRYTSQPGQDATTWTASFGGVLDLGRDHLGVSYEHLNLVETPNEIGSVATLPVPFRVDAASLSYDIMTKTAFSFLPELDVRHFTFDAVPIAGTNVTQSYRDRTSAEESLTSRYAFATGENGLLVLRGTEIRYDQAVGTLPRLNSNGGSVLIGFDYTATGLFRYRALVGYQVRDYTGARYGHLNAPIFEASVIWTVTQLTTATLTLRRDIEDSASEGVTGFTYTAGRLDLQHELRRNVIIGADLDVQNAQSRGSPYFGANVPFDASATNETIYSAGVTASYLLNRDWAVTATATFSDRHEQSTRSYTEGTGLISLRYTR